jgi:magnesium transporter
MEDLYKTVPKTFGMPPGSLIYSGKNIESDVTITITDYNSKPDLFDEKVIVISKNDDIETKIINLINPDPDIVRWIDVIGVNRIDIIEKIGNTFGIHPLHLEDILTVQNRPKMDEDENYLFFILKTMVWNDKIKDVEFEQDSIIMGSNWVITFQEIKNQLFMPVHERIKSNKGRIRSMDSDYLLYTLIDNIVDNYFVVLENIGGTLEDLEDELISDTSREKLKVLYKLKRENIALRNYVWPLREIVGSLQKNEYSLIKHKTLPYLRDVYDHIIQVIDTIENFRDIASGMLDIYLTSISNKTNETMKVLTIISTIFIPLTFLAGVYGMNFDFMPELRTPVGYPILWIVMITIAALLMYWFKRKNWI